MQKIYQSAAGDRQVRIGLGKSGTIHFAAHAWPMWP